MKRVFLCVFLFAFLMTLPQFAASVSAEKWISYPLVKDGVINLNKWRIDDSSAQISVAGDNRVVFEPYVGAEYAEDSAWLSVNKCPEMVKGIKVTVEMGADVTSELRGRIGLNFGAYGPNKDYLWAGLSVRKRDPADGGDRVYGGLSALEFTEGFPLVWDPTYVQFGNPIEVAGKTFTLTIVDKGNRIIYSVDGYGSSTYKLPESKLPPYELFWAIGTRSNDGSGSGPVYFSDVKLLLDGECDIKRPKVKSTYPANDQRKVPVDLEKIRVTFNEVMSPWSWSWNPPLSGETEFEHPKTFVIYNQGETLEYKRWYKVCLDKNGFLDLAGNGNRPYCFSFKTEKAPVTSE